MGRPRAFDAEKALEAAMQVFWAKGYEATSLADLLAVMKLSKSSFYETFGSKHALLLAALERYGDTQGKRLLGKLAAVGSARDAISAVFADAVETALANHEPRGCFANNCAVELGPHDPEAAARVAVCHSRSEDGFYGAIRRGQAAGDIPAERDARALARFLNNSLAGLTVIGKAGGSRKTLQDAVRITLRLLD